MSILKLLNNCLLMENNMNFFRNILVLSLLALSAMVLNSRAYAYGDYGLSCTNDVYGVHLGYVGAAGTTTVTMEFTPARLRLLWRRKNKQFSYRRR